MLHLYLLGVSDRVAGRGIGQQLVSACVENGARRGYRVAFAEAAGRASQHIFRKLGFAERAVPRSRKVVRGFKQELTEDEHYVVADHVVAQLKERGDPWRLNEAAKPSPPPTT
jgi:ribosomal protein S18 acetylase RimI-like enzyme